MLSAYLPQSVQSILGMQPQQQQPDLSSSSMVAPPLPSQQQPSMNDSTGIASAGQVQMQATQKALENYGTEGLRHPATSIGLFGFAGAATKSELFAQPRDDSVHEVALRDEGRVAEGSLPVNDAVSSSSQSLQAGIMSRLHGFSGLLSSANTSSQPSPALIQLHTPDKLIGRPDVIAIYTDVMNSYGAAIPAYIRAGVSPTVDSVMQTTDVSDPSFFSKINASLFAGTDSLKHKPFMFDSAVSSAIEKQLSAKRAERMIITPDGYISQDALRQAVNSSSYSDDQKDRLVSAYMAQVTDDSDSLQQLLPFYKPREVNVGINPQGAYALFVGQNLRDISGGAVAMSPIDVAMSEYSKLADANINTMYAHPNPLVRLDARDNSLRTRW